MASFVNPLTPKRCSWKFAARDSVADPFRLLGPWGGTVKELGRRGTAEQCEKDADLMGPPASINLKVSRWKSSSCRFREKKRAGVGDAIPRLAWPVLVKSRVEMSVSHRVTSDKLPR